MMTTTADLEDWAREMRSLLTEMKTLDLGYEFDSNELRPPAASVPDAVPAALRPMYRVFDGLSMPDVHSGYFLHTAESVAIATKRELPVRLGGSPQRDIHVFGSDGGGSLFALGVDDDAVFYLPNSAVEDGTYVEDHLVRARRVAYGLMEFLNLVKRDVRAFVEGRENHPYIINWVSPVDRAN